jgi:hypothetical protein
MDHNGIGREGMGRTYLGYWQDISGIRAGYIWVEVKSSDDFCEHGNELSESKNICSEYLE